MRITLPICETVKTILNSMMSLTVVILCRAAVKAGDTTSPYEREQFVKKLLSMPNIRYCPHGRPVMIKVSRYDIEKQFGRQG